MRCRSGNTIICRCNETIGAALKDLINALWGLSQQTELWSAIAGAVVGGLIALATQLVSLRASNKQRVEDRLYVQQALGGVDTYRSHNMMAASVTTAR